MDNGQQWLLDVVSKLPFFDPRILPAVVPITEWLKPRIPRRLQRGESWKESLSFAVLTALYGGKWLYIHYHEASVFIAGLVTLIVSHLLVKLGYHAVKPIGSKLGSEASVDVSAGETASVTVAPEQPARPVQYVAATEQPEPGTVDVQAFGTSDVTRPGRG